jgi:hypothetical protein
MAVLRVRIDLLLHCFDEFGSVGLFHGNPVVEGVWITCLRRKSERILHLSLKVLFPVILIIQGLPVDLGGECHWKGAVSEPLRSFTAPYGAPNTILIGSVACCSSVRNRSVRRRSVCVLRVDASTVVSELFTVEICLVSDFFRW